MSYNTEMIYAQIQSVPVVVAKYCGYSHGISSKGYFLSLYHYIKCFFVDGFAIIVLVIMICAFGCTSYEGELAVVDADEGETSRNFTSFFVILSVIHTLVDLPYVLVCMFLRNIANVSAVLNLIFYVVLVLIPPLCFAMVSGLRRQLVQSVGRSCHCRLKADEEEILMSYVK